MDTFIQGLSAFLESSPEGRKGNEILATVILV